MREITTREVIEGIVGCGCIVWLLITAVWMIANYSSQDQDLQETDDTWVFSEMTPEMDINSFPCYRTIYISTDGSDYNDCTSKEYPCQSADIWKRAGLKPGDCVLYEHGGIWMGNRSPVDHYLMEMNYRREDCQGPCPPEDIMAPPEGSGDITEVFNYPVISVPPRTEIKNSVLR